jgi:hypothetical protein
MRRDLPTVTIQLTMAEAESLSSGLSDLLCWCRGFMAASGDHFSHYPMGVEATRTLNLKLKSAMEAAEEPEPSI